MGTKIVNIKNEDYDVFIGRDSKWGNPFQIGLQGNRKEIIEKYRKWILANESLLKDLESLRGKRLGCYCKPKACHGDVLISLLNLKRWDQWKKVNNQDNCINCVHYGINFPYRKGGCYDCDEEFNNFTEKQINKEVKIK